MSWGDLSLAVLSIIELHHSTQTALNCVKCPQGEATSNQEARDQKRQKFTNMAHGSRPQKSACKQIGYGQDSSRVIVKIRIG